MDNGQKGMRLIGAAAILTLSNPCHVLTSEEQLSAKRRITIAHENIGCWIRMTMQLLFFFCDLKFIYFLYIFERIREVVDLVDHLIY